jgi:hypothetical protein
MERWLSPEEVLPAGAQGVDIELAQLRYLDVQPDASRRRIDLKPRHSGYTRRFLLAACGFILVPETMR